MVPGENEFNTPVLECCLSIIQISELPEITFLLIYPVCFKIEACEYQPEGGALLWLLDGR